MGRDHDTAAFYPHDHGSDPFPYRKPPIYNFKTMGPGNSYDHRHTSDHHRQKNITPGSRYVIISNHQSQFDILALVTSLRLQFRWVIKKELLRVPLFGWALYAARNVFIDRGNHEKALESIHKGVDRLPEGVSVLVFVEGTRSMDGTLGKFKKGGFMISVEKCLPILPVAVKGSRDILPKGSAVFTPGRIEVVLCNPVDPTGYTHDTINTLIGTTHGIIDQELRR